MKKIFSTLILGSLLLPTLVSAVEPSQGKDRGMLQNQTERRMEKKEARELNASTTRPRMSSSTKEMGFCAQIDKIIVQIGNNGSTSGEKRVENIEKRTEKREVVRTEVDTKREENDSKRKAQLAELTKRATTDEQKAAIATFTETIEKALADKKTATDAILAAHRKEVDQLVLTRKTTLEKALTTLKSDIDTAKKKAVADCANNVSGESVRTTLKDSILNAQKTFRTTTQSIQKDTQSEKMTDRKKELQAIDEQFKKSVEQAKNNLKSTFKIKSGTATTTN
jgi:hypothetical protein